MLKEKGIDAIAYFNAQDNAGSISVIALSKDDLQLVSENGVAVVENGDDFESAEGYRYISAKGLKNIDNNDIIRRIRQDMLSRIRSGELPLTINKGNQNKHIINSYSYKPEEKKSYIIGGLEEAQRFIYKYYGKGEPKITPDGKWTNKEFIIVDEDIGYVFNPETNEFEATNRFSIHYGKKGTHIVPRKRIKNETL